MPRSSGSSPFWCSTIPTTSGRWGSSGASWGSRQWPTPAAHPEPMASSADAFDPAIVEYYDRTPEETRLEQGAFQLERERTRELLQRFMPPPPATVVDVGGAAGAYALWLAEAGYSV